MPAPQIVLDLVQRFEQNIQHYRSQCYNEAQLRLEFLDPFFESLGWDLYNKQGSSEAYKDVVIEPSLQVEGVAKAPDYAFRIGQTQVFFVEAKKPAVNIRYDIHPAFQLRRYAWSAKLSMSILTDFEEFAVYDCRDKPDRSDQAATGRIIFFNFREYVDRWDEIASIFSRPAVLKGGYEKYISGVKGKHGTQDVDVAFLREMESWREALARNLAIRNSGLTVRELNYAVQMIIDRIVFLRICEDRGIEREDQLKETCQGERVYENLCSLFKQADARYNSGLFHFNTEKDQSSQPDGLTLTLSVDDKVLKEIISDLYYPSPYVFKEIPAEILGSVYERFLGKVIRLTPSHQAKIEEKPEVRKSGGVYYTPTYIVDYIVKNTVGKLLEGKSPKEAASLKIVDPACGSGSFLLGAYQYLLDWHRDWYEQHDPLKWSKGSNPAIYQSLNGLQLTTSEKKRILLNNIHGVDIDPQAVEVTKLSLSLKVLEGESQETIGAQLSLLKERALPDLGRNIQCGNSLIGSDYFKNKLFEDEDERMQVNPFDWESAFPQVFSQGGFDAVIGNPPYIRIQTLSSSNITYFSKEYKTAIGNYDIYCLFLEKATTLTKKNGLSGFIVPHRFFKTEYGDGLRKHLSEFNYVEKILDFDGFMVFEEASINTCIVILSNSTKDRFTYSRLKFLKKSDSLMPELLNKIDNCKQKNSEEFISGQLLHINFNKKPWIFIFDYETKLWEKIVAEKSTLGNISKQIFQGLKTGADLIYSVKLIQSDEKSSKINCLLNNKVYQIENRVLYPQVKGGDMHRYEINGSEKLIIFPYEKGKLIDENTLRNELPLLWSYFCDHKKYLENREGGKFKGSAWYGYTRSQALMSMLQPKILTPDYYAHPSFCFDQEGKFFFFGGGAGGYGVVLKNDDPLTILGILNSRLIHWFIGKISVRQYQTAFSYVKKYIEQIPIRSASNDELATKEINNLVAQQIRIRKRNPLTPQDKESLQREIDATDQQIDKLVYELYGLTEEEIKIVEGEK